MLFKFKTYMAKHVPALGKYKRWMVAAMDSILSSKDTYSQNGEDLYIQQILSQYEIPHMMYVDIGANHPTDISNTYLFYRKGCSGIIIEPNKELIDLFHRFRPRDIALPLGCGNKTGVLKFNISKTPVMSSFTENADSSQIYRQVYTPIMTLDDILSNFEGSLISILSIDVEGLNTEVLEGAASSLKKTLLLCIEFDSKEEANQFQLKLAPDFSLMKVIDCNMLFLNTRIGDSLLRKGNV